MAQRASQHRKRAKTGCALAAVCLSAAMTAHAGQRRAFFAFDNGLTTVKTPEEKAQLLAELGYDGIGWRPGGTAEMLKALDRHGLKLFTLYTGVKVEPGQPGVSAALATEIEILKGRGTIVWLGLHRGKGSTDEIAVKQLREVADKAAAAGLSVAIYPHVGFYAERLEHACRLVRAADRPNLGVSFNLCHFLKLDSEANMEAVLKAAAPYLMLVQVSGADSGETQKMGWDRLIQPLGKGSFDMRTLMRILDDIGYRGPINLQCYQVKGESRTHLAQSMAAWEALQAGN